MKENEVITNQDSQTTDLPPKYTPRVTDNSEMLIKIVSGLVVGGAVVGAGAEAGYYISNSSGLPNVEIATKAMIGMWKGITVGGTLSSLVMLVNIITEPNQED